MMIPRAVGGLIVVWSFAARAAITVDISQPVPSAAVGDSLAVAATITSPYALASVTAQVGSVSGAMTTSLNSTGTLDISTIPTGPAMLTVTVTDVLGGTGSANVTFAHDYAPVLTVTAPLPGTVARPTLHVAASCTDTDAYGCASIAVRLTSPTGTALASTSAATLDQTLDLTTYLGKQINLYIVATDTAGATTVSQVLPIYIDTSPRLVEVESVLAPIVDLDSTRILYGTSIHTRGTTSGDVTLPSSLGTTCRLSTNGAFCDSGEWKSGSIATTWTTAVSSSNFPAQVPGYTIAGRGNAAIWSGPDPGGPPLFDAYYRDSAGAKTTNLASLSSGFLVPQDVAANGDAVFILNDPLSNNYVVYLYRGGVWSAITDTSPAGPKYQVALTDGTNVIYHRWYLGVGGGGTYLYNESAATTVALVPDNSCNLFSASYALYNGWTVYAAPDGACTQQVWTRAPNDTRKQISIWSTDSYAEAVNDSGAAMLWNGSTRYSVAAAGGLPDAISSTLGRAVWLDSQWYVIMGRTLFSVAGPMPDGGTPDMTVLSDLSTPLDLTVPADLSVPGDLTSVPVDMAAPVDLAIPADMGKSQPGGCAVTPRAPSPVGAMLILLALLCCWSRRSSRPRV
jgi:hypothetical protein